MEAVRIILRGQAQKDHALKSLMNIEFNPDKLMELTIKPHKKNRSLEQNALYWKWMMICADELGYTKEGMHQTFMRELLAPIIIDTPSGDVMEYSTRKLNVKEMSSYMEQVSFTAVAYGVKLPHE
tara:strand:- start:52 stop:426 length:375 start_codon:yes stop_codon:yes gene_type:complete